MTPSEWAQQKQLDEPADRARALARGVRPWTDPEPSPDSNGVRTVVKRACNQCGHLLGDITTEEALAAIDGFPLPDVSAECGCTITDVCAHCLLPAGPDPCCADHNGVMLSMTQRAINTFRKEPPP